jgi:hypothetical protein
MQKVTPLIAEAILPILGFYYWDWSWYFILLFYIFDVIAKEVIVNLQANKIYKTQGGKDTLKIWKRSVLTSVVMGFIVFILLHILQYLRYPSFSVAEEITAFLGYEEMGLPQGLILLPLIGLNVWMQYKMNFLKLNLHLKMKMSEMWSQHIHYRLFILSIVALGVSIATIFELKDFVLLWSAVILPFIYVQFLKKVN